VGEDVVKLLEAAIQRHPDMDIEVSGWIQRLSVVVIKISGYKSVLH
jgi:hypothetical protein